MYLDGMTKLICSSSFDAAVDVNMRIIEDRSQLTKSAATIFGCEYADVAPDKDHVGIHVTALGDWEHYGQNRNGDSFPKIACQKFHDTFVKFGNLFRHHRNKDPEKRLGHIVKSAYNEPMGRIELFVHANREKAADELARLEKDGTIPFSMACVKAGTPIITARGTIPIEDVVPGDKVWTHASRWAEVGNRSVRTADSYYELRFVSWGRTVLEVTGNHEVLAATYEDIPSVHPRGDSGRRTKVFKRAHAHELHRYVRWIPVEQLQNHHYMLVPIERQVDVLDDVTADWARVMGYYMAEGSLASSATQFTCGVDDDCVHEVESLAPWTSVDVQPKSNSDKAVTVTCYGTELRDRLERDVGRAEGKRVPVWLMRASVELKYQFLAGWFNGDGWQDTHGLHWSTSVQSRAIDIQRLLASLDIPSSCMRIDHPEDRGIIVSPNAIEFVVSVSNSFSELFADISKADVLPCIGTTKCRTFISGDYLCVPVKSVTRIDKQAEVYNFSVAVDESYTAFGVAVHNCKVAYDRCNRCGNLRRGSHDPNQCEHVLPGNLGKVAEDGTVNCTHNDEPYWFDLSFVGRPADRIAWDLKVASGDTIDSVKLAEAAGVWVPDVLAITSPQSVTKLALMKDLAEAEAEYLVLSSRAPRSGHERVMWELRKAASDLSDAEITALREHEPADVFAALAHSGVVMGPRSFFKYAFGPAYGEMSPYVDGACRMTGRVFSHLIKAGECQRACNELTFDVQPNDSRTRKLPVDLLRKIAARSTLFGPEVEQRVILATIEQRTPKLVVDSYEKVGFNMDLTMECLAVKYAAYKLAALAAILDEHKDTDKGALIAVATAQNLVEE